VKRRRQHSEVRAARRWLPPVARRASSIKRRSYASTRSLSDIRGLLV
jgi:hypothetical protein